MKLSGRVAIVTGASSGIGRATALALARRGATLVAVARREPLLREVVRECRAWAPGSSHVAADLGERQQAERAVAIAFERCGRLDLLVNNAGMPMRRHVRDASPEDVETVLRVNYLSCVWTTRAAIPYLLRAGGGAIVNVSSFASKVVPPRESLYAASKGAMNAFTEGLWTDLAGSGIHVALVHPGPIETGIWEKGEPPSYRGRRYPPERVARAIVEAVERGRHEVVAPNLLRLRLALLLRYAFPALIRRATARMERRKPQQRGGGERERGEREREAERERGR